ncbi:MAG TPA: peptidylprolyl isomerase [Bacteroides sp.]|nr:peptidylprolyl isomerase [Bacteroides sp.]
MKKYPFFLIVSLALLIQGMRVTAQPERSSEATLIRMETTMGQMIIRLYKETPRHHDNMIRLIENGYYNGQLFHRVIADFMIQGGDPESANSAKGQRLGSGGPGYTLPAELHDHLIHKKGALAAAREGDQVNPEKRSSGSQFYIVQGRVFSPEELDLLVERQMHAPFTPEAIALYTSIGGTPHLDGSYTVFGEVVEGLDVIDRVASVETDSHDRPVEDVVYSITLVK